MAGRVYRIIHWLSLHGRPCTRPHGDLLKDTLNSPLLSLTNPNTNPYPNPKPNPAHTACRVHSHTQTYMHLLYRAHEQFS